MENFKLVKYKRNRIKNKSQPIVIDHSNFETERNVLIKRILNGKIKIVETDIESLIASLNEILNILESQTITEIVSLV